MMRLCELVRGLKTSDETLAAARAWAEGIGKTCIVVNRDVAGFVDHPHHHRDGQRGDPPRRVRVWPPPRTSTSPAGSGFGHAMGPLATADLTGIDVMRRASLSIYNETGNPAFFPPSCSRAWQAAGDLGRKSGRGFYSYGD